MKHIFLVFFLGFLSFSTKSQDRLFSQFYASPMTLNPALTGAFEGRFRVSAIYRDQWRSVMENAYSTFSSALDIKWQMGKKTAKYQDNAAVGLLFFSDKAGPLEFSTTQIAISAAYHKALDIRNTQILSIGFQGGIAQRNVNYADITFDDQFNGTTGYTDPTKERFPENNFAYADYSVGLNYVYSPRSSRFRVFAGGAMHHFFTPSVSFYKREDQDSQYEDNKLDTRYSAQLSMQMPVSKGVQFLPRAIFDKQGEHMKLDAGANVRFNTSEYKNVAMHLGAYLRPVSNEEDGINLDAMVALLGIEFNNVLIGLSYDLNISGFNNPSRKTFEISVAYLGEYEDDLILCPKF
jgi:type IX secretion system PorP/SprF family membrane protein